jgi:hypothetical protein
MDQAKQERARNVSTKLFHVLGSDDSVHTCDCCGKTNLKVTFAIEMIETGEILHYGSVCVTRNTGRKHGELNKMKEARDAEKRKAAQNEWQMTPECVALKAKRREAASKDLIGRAFKEHCLVELQKAEPVMVEIAARHGIERFYLH